MSQRRALPILFYLTAALAAGCGPASGPTPGLETPTLQAPTQAEQMTAPSASPTPGGRSGEAVITLDRSGGIAGISEHWTIYIDGNVIGPAEEEARVPADEVSQLLAEIEAAGFFEWPSRPQSPGSCADCFAYSILVTYQGKSNQVTLVNGASGAPEGAGNLLQRILGILNSVSE
jgi:hypothetical protein